MLIDRTQPNTKKVPNLTERKMDSTPPNEAKGGLEV